MKKRNGQPVALTASNDVNSFSWLEDSIVFPALRTQKDKGKPMHRIRRLREITQWMDKYLKA